MKKRANVISRIILMAAIVFTASGCGNRSKITRIVFDNNYQSVWKAGEIDFSALKFFVTYDDDTVEEVPVTIDMVDETDLYKFYKVGEWKIKINLNNKYSTFVDFIITENKFDDSICLRDEIVSYDGKSHSLSIDGPLPEGTKVYYPNGNNFTAASSTPYKVECVISKEGYKTKNLIGHLTITKSEYSKELLQSIQFENAEYIYDGTEKKIEAKNVPSDCTVDYYIENEIGTVVHGNSAVNAGEYTITGSIKCSNPNYFEIPDIKSKLIINKAKHNIENVSFNDAVFDYEEGVERKITLTNEKSLPGNIKVRYDNNVHEDAGEYTATAYFEVDSNHEPIEPMTAKLTIIPKELDLKTTNFQKFQTVKFDGTVKDFVVNTPSYADVEKKYIDVSTNKEVPEPIDAGQYKVQMSYKVSKNLSQNNYSLKNIPEDTGMLIIEKKNLDLSKIDFVNQSICYDGNPHAFEFSYEEEIDGETVVCSLPEELDVTVKYYKDGVELKELPKAIGEYVVSFDVKFKDEINGRKINPNNYSITNQPTSNGLLKIVKNKIDLSNVKTTDQVRSYNDGKEIKYELTNVPSSVIATIKYYKKGSQVNRITEVGNYDVIITFSLATGYSPEIYEIVNAPINAPVLAVVKKTINLATVTPKDIKVKRTGAGISYSTDNISNFGTVSQFVDVFFEYFDSENAPLEEGTYPKEVGKYRVDIHFALKSTCSDESYSLVNAYNWSVDMVIE